MKELTNTRRLTLAILVFVLILVVGFLTFQKPEFQYILGSQEILQELSNEENEITPDFINDIIVKNDPSYVFIDLRNPFEYNRGYIGEAINIPVSEILADASISLFDEMKENSITPVLYGKDQMEANGPWMLLTQLGYNNVKILLGGYNYFSQNENSIENNSEMPDYQVEIPVSNFAETLRNSTFSNDKTSKNKNGAKQIIPVKRKNKTKTAGGC